MLGPHLEATSGISNVVNNWIEAGIKDKLHLVYISTLDEYVPGHYLRKFKDALRSYYQFLKISRNAIDIVHIHMSSGMSFYRKMVVFFLSNLKGIKTIIHLHGSEFQAFYEKGGRLQKKLIEYVFRHAKGVIALSEAWQEFIYDISKNPNIYIIYNGASKTKFGDKTDNGGRINISFMGRLGMRKGTYDLLEAFKRLHNDFPQAYLILGGDGEIDKVQKIVDEEGLANRVQILGWVSGEEKIEVFRKTDIYVLPSYNEGLPGSILEAMAVGVPIISTPVGGIPEAVINDKNGYLIKPGDVNHLQQAISSLCKSKELRQKMGEESKKLIEQKFDITMIVEDLTKMYSAVGE